MDKFGLEKIVFFNGCLEGFDVVDKIKVVFEGECLGIVFCVDLLVFVVWDGVRLIGGFFYRVFVGCRDGYDFIVVEVMKNLFDLWMNVD